MAKYKIGDLVNTNLNVDGLSGPMVGVVEDVRFCSPTAVYYDVIVDGGRFTFNETDLEPFLDAKVKDKFEVGECVAINQKHGPYGLGTVIDIFHGECVKLYIMKLPSSIELFEESELDKYK